MAECWLPGTISTSDQWPATLNQWPWDYLGMFWLLQHLSDELKKASGSYIARLTGTKPDQPRFTIIRSGSWSARVNGAAVLMRPSTERTNEQLDPRQQLANTPSNQSTTPGLHPVSIHQMAPPKRASNCSLLLIYRPWKDKRLSWLGRLTCSGWFTHIVVTRRLQAERRTGSVRRPKTGVLPTVLRVRECSYGQDKARRTHQQPVQSLPVYHRHCAQVSSSSRCFSRQLQERRFRRESPEWDAVHGRISAQRTVQCLFDTWRDNCSPVTDANIQTRMPRHCNIVTNTQLYITIRGSMISSFFFS